MLAVEAQVNSLNKAMMAAATTPAGGGLNTKFLADYAKRAANVRTSLLSAVAAQGDFAVQSMKVTSHTDTLTEAIQRQKFGLRDLMREHRNLNSVYQKQKALAGSMVMQWSRNGDGTLNADMFTRIPKEGERAARTFSELRRQAGFYNQVLASVADQTVKWGKNTQWAGRQLMAGLSMPIAAAAAATGVLAYQVDKGLTQVVKVYGDAADAASKNNAQIRTETMSTAKQMASMYGQSVNDSIEITSQLASTGETGVELQKATAAVTRARTLGELNLQDAMKATITLQSVYQMNSQKLGETFDFMNSMENQTSLTMQDFVVGIPKVSGVIKEFGGDVQDAGILLAGMKAAGIDAAEGANAIKSIAFKVISPNQGAKDMFESLTGKSFAETMEGADGVVDRLTVLGEAIQGLSQEERVGLIQKMFGLYQGSKTLSLLTQLTEGSEQMTRAFAVANEDAAQWAATAQGELDTLTNSNWQRVKQAWETMKIQLGDIGETFLALGPPILNFFNKIFAFFNGLPPGVQKMMLFSTAAVAMLGPMIMLAGLMGNMIGNVAKFTTFIVGLALKFKIMNSEQVMSNLLAKQAAFGVNTEAAAYANLASRINVATQQLSRFALQQAVNNGTLGSPVSAVYTTAKNAGSATNLPMLAAPAATTVANQAEKTNTLWRSIRGHALMFGTVAATGAAAMATESGTTLNHVANAAFIAASLGPLLGRFAIMGKAATVVGTGFKSIGAFAGKALPSVKGVGVAMRGFLPAIAPIAGAFGAVAIAAGAAYYVINKNIEKSREEARQAADATKDYAKVLGFTYLEAGQRVDETGEKIATLQNKTDEFMKANEGAAKAFQAMAGSASTEEEKMNEAIRAGMKSLLHGASPDQARETVKIALRAMRSEIQENHMDWEINARINFDDTKSVVERQIRDIQNMMGKATTGGFSQGKSESFARFWTGDDDLNVKAAEAIRGQAREMWTIFSNANTEEQDTVFEDIRKNVMANQIRVFEDLRSRHSEAFAKAGLKTANDLARYTQEGGILTKDSNGNGLGMTEDDADRFRSEMDAVKNIIMEFGTQAGIADEKLEAMLDMSNLRKEMPYLKKTSSALQSVAKSQEQWDNFIKESEGSIVNWSDAEKLARLNLYRRRAGLKDATSVEQGFEQAIEQTTSAMSEQARVTKALQDAQSGATGIGNAGARTTDAGMLTNAYREAYSGAMDTIYNEASRTMETQNDAVMDAIETRGDKAKEALDREQEAAEARFDRQSKVFDRRWESTMDAFKDRWDNRKKTIADGYDSQISKIREAIEAEQKAEDIRQRIFEAERTRIQRLSDLYNRSIDINMAINSGNLDEAAKLSNDYTSTQEGWLMDDAAKGSGDASSERQALLENQIESIDKAKQARLDALEKTEEAERRALDARKEREKEALDMEQKNYQKSVEVRRKAIEDKVRREVDGQRRIFDANQRSLDAQLAALRAHVPQNQAQLNAHIKKVEAAYGAHGVQLQRKGTQWGGVVGAALKDSVANATIRMSNDIAWAALGKVAATEMAEGAFNMNLAEFMKWVTTGEAPQDYKPSALGAKLTNSQIQSITGGDKKLIYDLRHQGLHSGGIVGGSNGSRTGFSGNNQSQSEVWINALKGEAVLNRDATRNLGTDFVDMANKGNLPKNIGGPDLLSGFGGMMGMMMAGLVRKSMEHGILKAGMIRQMVASGASGMDYTAVGKGAGKYGGSTFNAEQLRNAGIIASTGKSLGASSRDIMIALMTAMQESTLRNLTWGDRDSVGLFQQRDAWGSFADRTNPAKAAAMFFNGGAMGQRGLFDFKNRGAMTLGQAAQAVQVSAFPGAYDKWSDEAAAILNSLTFSSTGGFSGLSSVGGWVRPANGPRTSAFGYRTHPITGKRTLHSGTDIGAPGGALIRAAKGGKVVSAGWNGGYGNYTVIDHGNGERTAYAHQSRFAVNPGQAVRAGQTIGYVGTTGASTGNHLHFEYMRDGQRINPGLIIPGLKTGGFAMSDGLAKLHQGEAVIPAKLTERLKSGIENMDKSQHFGYTVNMDFNGANINNVDDFKGAVEEVLIKIENRRGPSRRIGG